MLSQSTAATFWICGRPRMSWNLRLTPITKPSGTATKSEINYKDGYRVDFFIDLAEKFLRQKQEKLFLL
jgi:hypothetical protein